MCKNHVRGLEEITPETEGVIKTIYTNYKGETSVRTLLPIQLVFKHSSYHSKGDEKVWIIIGYDLDKKAYRDFALNDMIVGV